MWLISKALKIVPQTAADAIPTRMTAAEGEPKQQPVFLDMCEGNQDDQNRGGSYIAEGDWGKKQHGS